MSQNRRQEGENGIATLTITSSRSTKVGHLKGEKANQLATKNLNIKHLNRRMLMAKKSILPPKEYLREENALYLAIIPIQDLTSP